MDRRLTLLAFIAFLSIIIPISSAQPIRTSYNCTDGYLISNMSGNLLGTYREITFQNSSCAPYVCARNGLMCNSPENNDPMFVMMSGFMFFILGFGMLYVYKIVDAINNRYKLLKYLYFLVGACMIVFAIVYISAFTLYGPNDFEGLNMFVYIILGLVISITAFVIGVSELEDYVKKLLSQGKRIRF